MSYAIMRIQKIKSMQALAEREKYNLRHKTVFSSDGSNNIVIHGKKGLVVYVKALEEQINKKNIRKTRKDLRALQDSFFEAVKHLGDLERGRKVELTNEIYTHNKEWNRNIAKARNLAEALSEEKRFDYAIRGVLSEETEKKLKKKIEVLIWEKEKLKDKNLNLEKDFKALKNINFLNLQIEDKEKFINQVISEERKKIEQEQEFEYPTMEELGL